MQVSDETVLAQRLQTMGYVPLAVQAAGGRTAAPVGLPAGVGVPGLRRQSLSRFYYQLHMSLHAGLSAYDALTDLTVQSSDRGVATVAASMAEVAQRGGSLADGMSQFPGVFPPGDIGLIRASEMGGFVVEALQEMHTLLEADIETQRQVSRILIGFGVLLGIALFVTLPAIGTLKSTITASWNGAQQSETLQLLAVQWARTLALVTLPLVLVSVLAAWALRRWIRTPRGQLRWHRFLLGVPGIGGVAFARSRAVFSAALRLLYHGGVNPPSAWTAASDAVPNRELSRRMAMQNSLVDRGATFSEAMRGTGVFPASDGGMLATGERTGNVEEVLAQLASSHHRAAGEALARLPATSRIMAMVLGAVITAILVGYGLYNYASTLVGLPTDG